MGSTKSDSVSNSAKTSVKPYGKIVLTLKNQLLPDDKLKNTPSQIDGLDVETENDLRIYGCELIQTAGILLKLPQVAMATGQVLLQRFYYSKSLVRHPVEHTAMACVCLASKIEEDPRRVRDIINVFTHIRQVNSNKPIQPVILDQNYVHLKNLVIKAERRVLKELGFCVHIKHPHKLIVMYLQVLGMERNQKLMQYSWNYMNDSLRTDVFMRYQPEIVACACISLTARTLRLPLPRSPVWYGVFGANDAQIRDISIRILKLYSRPKTNVEALEKKVEELAKKYQDARAKAKASSGNNTPNNNEASPKVTQKSAGAHNAWGGFISRSGSHIVPTLSEKNSRSRSPSASPPSKSHKRSKKHGKSRSRSPRNHKRGHKRRSYSRSRSPSPKSRKTRDRRRSRSQTVENERNDRYIDRYDEYKKDRYEKDRYNSKDDKYSDKDRYDEKKDKYEKNDRKYDKEDRYKDDKYKEDKYRDDKYSRSDKDKHSKKSKHKDDDRQKDRRR
ncbi:cyclin-L2 [Coccinella septempunctata]|uniref:cyclin-L2 n=1 Tax=Coccinella septempunctata TaxID=41139 RepID=UPI001D07EAE4|nr:cyclin-L2 [Coccinella septempunctata]